MFVLEFAALTEKSFWNHVNEKKMDSNYTFPIDLEPNEILFGYKSIEKC